MTLDLFKGMTWSDVHTHIDKSPEWDPNWPTPCIKQTLYHIEHDRIDELWVIVRHPERIERLLSLRKQVPSSCLLRYFIWVPNVKAPDVELITRLTRMNLCHGLKVHPRVDRFTLGAETMQRVTDCALALRLPVIFHTDCNKGTMHRTPPDGYEALIAGNPGIPFVIGHGGAYALTRLGPPEDPSVNCPGRNFWREDNGQPYSIGTLIREALRITAAYPNAYYDTSVSTNPGKARLTAEFINARPSVAAKILVGTDYPVQWARCPTQVASLLKKGLREDLALVIARNRFSRILADWAW